MNQTSKNAGWWILQTQKSIFLPIIGHLCQVTIHCRFYICILNPQAEAFASQSDRAELQGGTKSCSPCAVSSKSSSVLAAPPLCNPLLHLQQGWCHSPAQLLISPTFSQLLAKAVSQMKPVCAAYDRILAIERLHTLTAEQMSALTLTNHAGEE